MGELQKAVGREPLPPSRPLPRPGIISPSFQVLALVLVLVNGGWAAWLYLDRDDWQQKAKVSEEANRRLMQARCAEAACALQYDERIVASPDGASLPTTVWGTAPIACKQAGHVPWVRPDWDGSGFEFMCLPDDGLQIRGAE